MSMSEVTHVLGLSFRLLRTKIIFKSTLNMAQNCLAFSLLLFGTLLCYSSAISSEYSRVCDSVSFSSFCVIFIAILIIFL